MRCVMTNLVERAAAVKRLAELRAAAVAEHLADRALRAAAPRANAARQRE